MKPNGGNFPKRNNLRGDSKTQWGKIGPGNETMGERKALSEKSAHALICSEQAIELIEFFTDSLEDAFSPSHRNPALPGGKTEPEPTNSDQPETKVRKILDTTIMGNNPRVLIGICSCARNREKRSGVRETWMPGDVENTSAVFFVGDGLVMDEDDVWVVPAPDGYRNLPAKVMAFFRTALEKSDFDWVIKCDDDTYLYVERFIELLSDGRDFVGNEFLEYRGSPSGGAGYAIRRPLLELLVKETIPAEGDEDVLIGEACIRLGARAHSTSRLCWNGGRFPRRTNNVVSSHWLMPEAMVAVHTIATCEPDGRIDLTCRQFSGRVEFYENGVFCRSPEDEFGTWDIDTESNLVLHFHTARKPVVVPVAGLFGDCVQKVEKVGILVIATSRYRRFLWPLIKSIRTNFTPGHERTIFVFTDVSLPECEGVKVIRTEHRPWPEVTLFRYRTIHANRDVLAGQDYLFYIDADMLVSGPVGDEIFSELTAVCHPGYRDVDSRQLPYSRNRDSLANVGHHEGRRYFCGAFQGGSYHGYMRACEEIAGKIENDWKRDVIAEWHDESHWNRYLIDNEPAKSLSDSYCRPEHSTGDTPRKITALDKQHDECRSGAIWPEKIIALLEYGMGNQMFQYAHGLALAWYFGAEFEVRAGNFGGRGFSLGQYGIRLTGASATADEMNVEYYEGYTPGREKDLINKVLALGCRDVVVKGFFQNLAFFKSVEDEVRTVFARQVKQQSAGGTGQGGTDVFVHVRRGDYVGKSKFDVCAPEYFRKALKVMRVLVDNPRFTVLSDDPDWCSILFAGEPDVDVPADLSADDSMRRMIRSDAGIISNSTFGWWGAWLSASQNIIAPGTWLNGQHWEIVSDNWIRLPSRASGSGAYAVVRAGFMRGAGGRRIRDAFEPLRASLEELRGRKVYYMPNSGNWGDGLIRAGTLTFFADLELDVEEVAFSYSFKPGDKDAVFIYGGGGGWCRTWPHGRQIIKAILPKVGKVIVLPSTYALPAGEYPAGVEYWARDRFISLKFNKEAKVCPDMALYLPGVQLEILREEGSFFRLDAERSGNPVPPDNRDISAEGNHLSDVSSLLREVGQCSVVKTDRLHVGIAALLAGRETRFHASNYPKIEGAVDTWFRPS